MKSNKSVVLNTFIAVSVHNPATVDWIPADHYYVKQEIRSQFEGIIAVKLDQEYSDDLKSSGWDAFDLPDLVRVPVCQEIASHHGITLQEAMSQFEFKWKKSDSDVYSIQYWN